MPQKNAQGIDVSAEEERYLRSAFRRFALPYVLVFAAIAVSAWIFGGSEAGGASPESVQALEQEVARLRVSLEDFEGRLASVGADLAEADGRVAALEKNEGSAKTSPDAALEQKLRDATRRVADLEKKLADQAVNERFDALTARMTRIENQAQAPAPAAADPPPAL